MKRVIVESPYFHIFRTHQWHYRHYLMRAMLDCLENGEAPFASHYIYTEILSDNIKDERRKGFAAGFAWMAKADLVAVYQDWGVSAGMRKGIDEADRLGIQIAFREIGRFPHV